MSKIIMSIGLTCLIIGVMIAGVGVVLSIIQEPAEHDAAVDGDGNVFTGSDVSVTNYNVFIGYGVILASFPVSILGLALIIIGRFSGFQKKSMIEE